MSEMTALVLCGGLGTRLRPVVSDVPKALASVAGQPFLHHLLRFITGYGFTDIVLCTGFGADQITAFCGDGSRWGARIRYSQETQPLGTAGALKNAEGSIESRAALVFNGDSLVAADLALMAKRHEEKHASITMAVARVDDQSRFGSVILGDGGIVSGFREKGVAGEGWINAGVYAIERSVIASIPAGRPVSLEQEIFPQYIGNGFFAVETRGSFIDIGTPASYGEAQRVVTAR